MLSTRHDKTLSLESELEKAPPEIPILCNDNDATHTPQPQTQPQLHRSLSWIGAIGLAFTITDSWMSYTATFGTALVYGGGVTVLFGVMVAAVAQWIVLLGVCEMVSAIPSSGGCYHFTYFLASKKTRTFTSFIVGIINLLGFWIGGVSGAIYTTASIFGMVSFWVDDFNPTQWEVYLAYVGVIILSLIPIFTISPSKTKYLTTACLTLSLLLLALFITILTSLARTRYRTSNLILHQNRSGHPDPTAWLLSISLGMYSFSATGTIVHLSEEVPRPGKGIPVAINSTMALGISTAIPFITVLLIGIQDVEAVQNAWIPSLEAFYQATGSKAVATALQACLAFLYYTTVSTQWVSVSRIAWALARDNALPFSPYFTHISPRYNFPIRTTLLSFGFFIVFGLIYIASSTAFDSFVNMATLLVNIAFTVPQGILLACRRRDRLPREREFSLGRRVGYLVNGFSVCWLVFAGVLFCFPTRVPTSKGEMNYGSVVLIGLFLCILIMYIFRRGTFQGPQRLYLDAI